jgi:exodeoxyribonuclease VII small subunit
MAERDDAAETPLTVEESLEELEQLVVRLEHGEGDLEAALADFERGVGLVRSCTEMLSKMELRVQELVVTEDGEIVTNPFDEGDGGEDRDE